MAGVGSGRTVLGTRSGELEQVLGGLLCLILQLFFEHFVIFLQENTEDWGASSQVAATAPAKVTEKLVVLPLIKI